MFLTELPVGSNVLIDIERKGMYFTLTSKIADSSDKGIFVYPPYNKLGEIKDFREGDKLQIRYIFNKKVLQWECVSWKEVVSNTQKLVYFTSDKEGESLNKREAFRVDIPMKTELIDFKNRRKVNIKTKDISQLGIGFTSSENLGVGDIFSLTFSDLDMKMELWLKIVRKSKNDIGYTYGAVIIQSTQILKKYINQKQIEEIRNRRKFGR